MVSMDMRFPFAPSVRVADVSRGCGEGWAQPLDTRCFAALLGANGRHQEAAY